MVSHDLLRSTVTNQILFDQRDSKSIVTFERAMNRCYRLGRQREFMFSTVLNCRQSQQRGKPDTGWSDTILW